MLLEIITPDAKLFDGEVLSIELAGTNGRFQILNITHRLFLHRAGKISIALDKIKKSSRFRWCYQNTK